MINTCVYVSSSYFLTLFLPYMCMCISVARMCVQMREVGWTKYRSDPYNVMDVIIHVVCVCVCVCVSDCFRTVHSASVNSRCHNHTRAYMYVCVCVCMYV